MKAKKSNIWLRGIGLFCLFAAIGCGRWASAPDQETITMPIPEYPSLDQHVLSLTDGSATVGYGGTMLLFNENTTGDLVADVLQASIDSRRAWAESRRFEAESRFALMYSNTGIIPNAIQDMQAELRRFESTALARNPVPLEEKKENSKAWLQNELDLLYGTGSSSDKERASRMFGFYCDAKLIELATNSHFAGREYLERPSPLGFCEAYYEDRGYFQSEICEADLNGRSYFECLWRDGVFHTHWFADELLNPDLDSSRAEAITSLLDEENLEIFQGVMALDESYMVMASPAFQRLIFGPSGDRRNYFSNIILQQTQGTAACARVIPDLAQLCNSFAITRTAAEPQSGLGAGEAFPLNPFDTISAMEERDAGLASYFPLPERPQSEVSTKEILAFYGQRNLDNHRNSENDRHLHLLASGEALPSPELSNRLVELSSKAQNALTPTVYPTLSADDLQTYNRRLERIRQLENDLQQAWEKSDDLRDQIRETSTKGFIAGAAGDIDAGTQVAHAFIEIRLKVSNRAGLVRSYFWIRDHESFVVYGCYDTISNKTMSPEECPAETDRDRIRGEIKAHASKMLVDPSSGRLDFGFLITEARELGLGYKARVGEEETPDSFMDFQDHELLGKELVFELFPNRIYDHLEILAGKAFIRHAGELEYEAGISLWDQNL